MAPVFLGAEDHPPRDRRPKCLTGSAITLVRLARPNPRGRHARVADPSGVECQRDGSDQGQRMEAGDGALTRDRSSCPVTGCPPLASIAAMRVASDQLVQTGKVEGQLAIDEYGRAGPSPWKPHGIRLKRHTIPAAGLAAFYTERHLAWLIPNCSWNCRALEMRDIPACPCDGFCTSPEPLRLYNWSFTPYMAV